MFTALLATLFATADSPVKSDEVVVFFPTFAKLDADKQHWTLPIHGWIFEPEMDSLRRRFALGMLRRALDLDEQDAETAYFQQRARAFLVDNEAGKKVPIRLGERTVVLDAVGVVQVLEDGQGWGVRQAGAEQGSAGAAGEHGPLVPALAEGHLEVIPATQAVSGAVGVQTTRPRRSSMSRLLALKIPSRQLPTKQ